MKLALVLLLLTGCASPVELRDASVDRPNADRPNIPDSPFIQPSFDVPAVDAIERDAVEIDSPAVDVPNRDVPNRDAPNAVDMPTVNDVPSLVCPAGTMNCGMECCLGFASCGGGGGCGGCMPGANTVCTRPDRVLLCINDLSNASHCGRCNNPCPMAAPFCVAGRCTPR